MPSITSPLGKNIKTKWEVVIHIRMAKSEKTGKANAGENLESGCSYQYVKGQKCILRF